MASGQPGFGTRLIDRTVASLRGGCVREYRADGLRCGMRFPIEELGGLAEAA